MVDFSKSDKMRKINGKVDPLSVFSFIHFSFIHFIYICVCIYVCMCVCVCGEMVDFGKSDKMRKIS